MNRRTALAFLSSTATAPFVIGSALRALAQSTAATTLTYGQSGAVTVLDPAQGAFATYPAGYEVAYCLYDRLVDFDENLRFVPQLAESWDTAPDLKSIRFRLRKHVHLVLDVIQRHPRKQDYRKPSAVLLQIPQHIKPVGTGHIQVE